MFETKPYATISQRPRRRRRGGHYWRVTVTKTESGWAIHESRGETRHLCGIIAEEGEAWDYAERRAARQWRVLVGERPLAAVVA